MAAASKVEGQVCLHPPASVSGVQSLSLLILSLLIPQSLSYMSTIVTYRERAPQLCLFHFSLFALGRSWTD